MTKEIIVDESKEGKIKQQNAEAQLNEKILTYRILQGHMEEIRKEAEMLERKFFETEATKQLLEDLRKSKKESEILLPVGNGLFVKGTVTDRRLLMDIGAGVLAGKNIEDSEAEMVRLKAEIEETVTKLNGEMAKTVEKMNGIAADVREIQQAAGLMGHKH